MKTTVLSYDEISQCLTADKAIELVEYVFNEWGKGDIVMPAKITLDMTGTCGSWSNAMPAYLRSSNAAGIKWIGGYARNPDRGLPYLMGVIVLTEPETGRTLSFMDGTFITNIRTGASAAVSAKHLAGGNVSNICIVGAGQQGRACAMCLDRVYPDAALHVYDISADNIGLFARDMSGRLVMQLVQSVSLEESVRAADIIVLVTTATVPFVCNAWIKSGATVLAMGSFQQIEDDFALSADKIIVDSCEQALHRGELEALVAAGRLSRIDIYSELGDIVIGRKPGRQSPRERVLVVPVGLGAHDICIARHVYEVACAKNMGVRVSL